MIPKEVEYRIAAYFFHNYLPEDLRMQVEESLLTPCLATENEENLDYDELVRTAVHLINEQLEGKTFK